jgi:hypothetical protein
MMMVAALAVVARPRIIISAIASAKNFFKFFMINFRSFFGFLIFVLFLG